MSFLSDLLGDAYKEGMTEDEISAALEGAGIAGKSETDRLKASLSKANSEAAGYKKQLRTKQTDAEALEAARKEEHDKLVQENNELRTSIALAERKAKLIGIGYDEALAAATAKAMVDGDMDTVIANQSKYMEAREKDIRSKQMRQTPRPQVGPGGVDYAKEIADAQASGNVTAAAYYTRLQQSEMQDE